MRDIGGLTKQEIISIRNALNDELNRRYDEEKKESYSITVNHATNRTTIKTGSVSREMPQRVDEGMSYRLNGREFLYMNGKWAVA
jgi:hypothetical protein